MKEGNGNRNGNENGKARHEEEDIPSFEGLGLKRSIVPSREGKTQVGG